MLRRLFLAACLLVLAPQAWSQVAHDADGTVCNFTGGTFPKTCTPITVGSGANRGLVVFVLATGVAGTTFTVNWDSTGTNQSMTNEGNKLGNLITTGEMLIFCLAAPTSGLKTLSINAVGGSGIGQLSANAVSFSGVNQTTPCKTFTGANDGGTNSTPATVTVSSVSGDFTAAAFMNDNQAINSVSATEIDSWVDNSQGTFDSGGNYHAGAASNVMTGTLSAAGDWIAAGIDIAAAAGGTVCPAARSLVGVGC